MAKKFKLKKEEIAQLIGRRRAREYVSSVISDDMETYIRRVVVPRLKSPPGATYQLNLEEGTLEIINSAESNGQPNQ